MGRSDLLVKQSPPADLAAHTWHDALRSTAIAQGLARPTSQARLDGHDWTVTIEGSVVTVKYHSTVSDEGRRPVGVKGVIGDFSPRARRRCLQKMASYEWGQLQRVVFVTLTWHVEDAPTDGLVARDAVRRFGELWRYHFGSLRGAWKREFTRAGAVHYHLWLDAPSDETISQLRSRVAAWWYASARTGRFEHLLAGTSCEEAFAHPARYAAGYATAKGTKEYQHVAPANFTNLGRWWGVLGMDRQPSVLVLDRDQAVKLRRYAHRIHESRRRMHALSRGYRPPRRRRPPTRWQSSWLIADFDNPGPTTERLLIAAGVLRG